MTTALPPERILILDFGAQYTQLIARRIRESRVYCEIWPYSRSIDSIRDFDPKGIVLSGGPASLAGREPPICDRRVLDLPVPILGICYGQQLLAHQLGGECSRPIGASSARPRSRSMPRAICSTAWAAGRPAEGVDEPRRSGGDPTKGFRLGGSQPELALRRDVEHLGPGACRRAVPSRGRPYAARSRDPRQLRVPDFVD